MLDKACSLVVAAAALVLAAGCGGSDSADDPSQAAPAAAPTSPADDAVLETTTADDSVASGDATDPPGTPEGRGDGTVVLDGEVIDLTEIRCHLESQPAAGGGGNIEFVVQGAGVTPAGEPFMIDVSRYDEDSMFEGDAVQLYVGDITSDEAREFHSTAASGTVSLVGSTATVDDLVVEDVGVLSEHIVSFDITCR